MAAPTSSVCLPSRERKKSQIKKKTFTNSAGCREATQGEKKMEGEKKEIRPCLNFFSFAVACGSPNRKKEKGKKKGSKKKKEKRGKKA